MYLESYTSILPGFEREALEEYYGRGVEDADRDFVEQGCDAMLDRAATEEVPARATRAGRARECAGAWRALFGTQFCT